jgi:hypothetical protein
MCARWRRPLLQGAQLRAVSNFQTGVSGGRQQAARLHNLLFNPLFGLDAHGGRLNSRSEKAAAADKTATALKFGHGSNAYEIRSFCQANAGGLTNNARGGVAGISTPLVLPARIRS